MDLKTKRKNEMDEQKYQRRGEVISAAIEVFKKKGIESTKMTDIAEQAQLGVATVYRYFKSKPELAIEASIRFWEEEIRVLYSNYISNDFLVLKGIDKVRSALSVFLILYRDHKSFISFIEQFDNYIVKEKISIDRLENYEKNITNLKRIIVDSIEEGKSDGTVKQDTEGEKFYIAVTHALMSLCQKLILRGNIIASDVNIDGEEQIILIIEMAINYIKK